MTRTTHNINLCSVSLINIVIFKCLLNTRSARVEYNYKTSRREFISCCVTYPREKTMKVFKYVKTLPIFQIVGGSVESDLFYFQFYFL